MVKCNPACLQTMQALYATQQTQRFEGRLELAAHYVCRLHNGKLSQNLEAPICGFLVRISHEAGGVTPASVVAK